MTPDYDRMSIKEAARAAEMIEEREALEMDIKAGLATPQELYDLLKKQGEWLRAPSLYENEGEQDNTCRCGAEMPLDTKNFQSTADRVTFFRRCPQGHTVAIDHAVSMCRRYHAPTEATLAGATEKQDDLAAGIAAAMEAAHAH